MNHKLAHSTKTPSKPSFKTTHLADSALRQQHIDDLESKITELAAHINAATFSFLVLIRKYDQCEGWSTPGMRSSATAIALLTTIAPALFYLRPSMGSYLLRPCSRASIG